jgi:DNA-binding response OmpR family regulator
MDTILLLEDEHDAGRLLKDFLELNGFRVLWFTDGQEALRQLPALQDVLRMAVLDVMVPGADGFAVLHRLRELPRTRSLPILFLTAKDQDEDAIRGLAHGADDYLAKPAGMQLVLAHIQALLRRTDPAPPQRTLADVTLNYATQEVLVAGQRLPATQTEFKILALLVAQPNRAISREEIIQQLGDDGKDVFDRTIDAHIKNLRTKLGPAAAIIKTYRGLGYGLNPEYAGSTR